MPARRRLRRKQTPTYKSWASMIQRCCNPKSPQYADYGGRGIRVCPQWRASFLRFARDMGPRPSKDHSLGRIDNDGHYQPGNVRWETSAQQAVNKRTSRHLTFQGQTMTLSEWAKVIGVSRQTLANRLKSGWTLARALTSKLDGKRSMAGRKNGRA